MSDNNFLDSLAKSVEEEKKANNDFEVNGRPASFSGETFTRIEKKKISLTPKQGGAILLGFFLLCVFIYLVFLRPTIEVPDFVGKNISEVTTWVTQNQITKTGIATTQEYNFEYDKDVVVSQSIEPGKFVKKDVKLNLVVSNGADPNELISFPDIKEMTYSELQNWISTNKLQQTKISTEYSTTVEKDHVISFDLKNVSQDEFKRNSSLTIKVSKGVAPAGQVTVEDFVNKTYDELVTWAKNKKVTVEKVESFSDTVAQDKIISQSVKAGETMETTATLTVTVSKGKAVKVPNFVGYDATMLEAWLAQPDHKVSIIKKTVYNEAPEGNVIAQNVAPGTQLEQGSSIELTVSLYLPILQTNSKKWVNANYMELIAWVDEVNSKGANIAAGIWRERQYSSEIPADNIISYTCEDANGNLLSGGANGCERPLPTNAKISLIVSKGPDPVTTVTLPELTGASLVSTSDDGMNIVAKSYPNTLVEVYTILDKKIGSGTTNELGYAEIELSEALPTHFVLIITVDGQRKESHLTKE